MVILNRWDANIKTIEQAKASDRYKGKEILYVKKIHDFKNENDKHTYLWGDGTTSEIDYTNENDLESADNWFSYIGIGAAMSQATQIGMFQYRRSLSVHSRIGTFSRFSSNYRMVGLLGRGLGSISYLGALTTQAIDFNSWQNDEIGTGRFLFRTTGTVTSAAIGKANPIYGAVTAGGFWSTEIAYDGFNEWALQMSIFINNTENALKNGWPIR